MVALSCIHFSPADRALPSIKWFLLVVSWVGQLSKLPLDFNLLEAQSSHAECLLSEGMNLRVNPVNHKIVSSLRLPLSGQKGLVAKGTTTSCTHGSIMICIHGQLPIPKAFAPADAAVPSCRTLSHRCPKDKPSKWSTWVGFLGDWSHVIGVSTNLWPVQSRQTQEVIMSCTSKSKTSSEVDSCKWLGQG